MLMQSKHARLVAAKKNRVFSSMFSNVRETPVQGESSMDLNYEKKRVQEEREYHHDNPREERLGDIEERDDNGGKSHLSGRVLDALKKAKNSAFQLPHRKPDESEFDSMSLERILRTDQTQVMPLEDSNGVGDEMAVKHQQDLQQQYLQQQPPEMNNEAKQFDQQAPNHAMTPLEQFQQRSQQLERQQLQHLHQQQNQQVHAFGQSQGQGSGNYKSSTSSHLIPADFRGVFASVWEPLSQSETPLFWHIPKNGGTTAADIFTHCLDLVSASNIGATEGHNAETSLHVRRYHDKGQYVNVNVASPQGIERAKSMGLIPSHLAEVVVLHRFHEGAQLFDSQNRARAFCLFRHPVHRAVSMFYYLQRAKWEPTYDPSLANTTLLQYAFSTKVEENWVTRFLTHQYSGQITEDHVAIGKAIMRDKVLVGILEDFQESLKRFEVYFGWWETKVKPNAAKVIQCQQNKARASQNKIQHPMPDENDPAFQRLIMLNWADMELYNYAKQLFEDQGELAKEKDASML